MLAHARSGDAAFTACLRLFRNYPMAVRRHYAEHRYGSMVLVNRDAGTPRFFVLIMEWEDLFVFGTGTPGRAPRGDRARPGGLREVSQVIEASIPVPRTARCSAGCPATRCWRCSPPRPAARAVG